MITSLREIAEKARENSKISDFHVVEEEGVYYRNLGALKFWDKVDGNFLENLLKTLPQGLKKLAEERLEKKGGADFSIEELGIRFRVAVRKGEGKWNITFRRLPEFPPKLEELGLYPETEKALREILRKTTESASKQGGLILIAGATGSGKSTTVGALIREIVKYPKKLITLEDPIEYKFSRLPERDTNSLVIQRELGLDFPNFAEGIYQGLREDPDVILVGELRDENSANYCVIGALTGHLVFSTIHAERAIEAITGLITKLEGKMNPREARGRVASCLIGVIAQKLIKVGEKRILVHEALFPGERKSYIERGEEGNFRSFIDNMNNGSISFEGHSAYLVSKGILPLDKARILFGGDNFDALLERFKKQKDLKNAVEHNHHFLKGFKRNLREI